MVVDDAVLLRQLGVLPHNEADVAHVGQHHSPSSKQHRGGNAHRARAAPKLQHERVVRVYQRSWIASCSLLQMLQEHTGRRPHREARAEPVELPCSTCLMRSGRPPTVAWKYDAME